jgi:hypothetical protein
VETHLFESLILDEGLLTIEHLFQLCRWDVSDGFEESAVVKPVDPFEGGELHVFESLPGSLLPDHFGLVEAVDGLGESIVVGVTPGSNGGDDAGFREALGVADGEVLDTAVTMVNEAPNIVATPPESHLKSIERQIGPQGAEICQPRIMRE